VAALLRRRPLAWDIRWAPDLDRPTHRHPLCASCQAWIAGVLREIRESAGRAPLYGSPSTGDRTLVFDDQCNICHAFPAGGAAIVDCVAVGAEPHSWPPLFVCSSCEAWVASLADDGRSARGRIDRNIDGPYGEWPHPNLRELSVELEVADRAARATIIESCIAMEVPVRGGALPASAAVLMVEVAAGGDATPLIRGSRGGRPAVIALAPLTAQRELDAALRAGAAGWLTLPLTPQQVTAALTTALRRTSRRAWDPETCLPIASLVDVDRPTLVLEPAPGVGRFEVAWLARRFSRGYDELAVAGGHIVLLPKVPPDRLYQVQSRLELLLRGRCHVVALEPAHTRRERFDVAG
jgi:CheY-like chemotaxis protein